MSTKNSKWCNSKGEQHVGKVLNSKNGFDIIECQTCGFKHIIPIPTPSELENVYKNEYYTSEKPLYIKRAIEDVDWWDLVYSEYYDLFEKYLPQNRRKLLEIGSGPGFFLKHGTERGWDVLGVEPSVKAAEHSKSMGLNVINGFFDENMVDSIGNFDVVYLHEVLEHVPNPADIVEFAKKILNLGGLICLIVPNDYNSLQNILAEHLNYDEWWIAPPHHINYFSFDSLKNLIESKQFKTLEITTTFPMELFLLMGDNYVGNDSLGRLCHNKRKTLDLNLKKGNPDKKDELYKSLAKLNIGREVVIIGQKE